MGLFFSKKRKVTAHDRAVLELKVQRDKLKQYSTRINAAIDRETEIARELLKQGKKKQAVLALKKKKYQEGLLQKSEGQLENIQTMVDSIEFAIVEKKVFESLRLGNTVLQDIHKEIGGVDAVEDLMEDTREAIQNQNDMEEALAGKLTPEDEEELERELDLLEKETAPSSSVSLPDAPKHDPLPEKQPVAEEEEEAEEEEREKEAEAEEDDDDEIIVPRTPPGARRPVAIAE